VRIRRGGKAKEERPKEGVRRRRKKHEIEEKVGRKK
jgi:hypothetical protein